MTKLKTPRTSLKSQLLKAVVAIAGGCTLASQARANNSDYRWGFAFGYGAMGISTTSTVTTNATTNITTGSPATSYAEGPLMAELYLDRFISDRIFLTFSHSRGITMVPFSSGASFTGVSASWYFFGEAPSSEDAGETSIFVKRWAPFAGLGAGVAQASITRNGTINPTVAGAGVYFGGRLGFDVPTGRGHGIRPEVVFGSTSFSGSFGGASATPPPTLNMFSLQCGWYWDF